jgi:hypothetical protein
MGGPQAVGEEHSHHAPAIRRKVERDVSRVEETKNKRGEQKRGYALLGEKKRTGGESSSCPSTGATNNLNPDLIHQLLLQLSMLLQQEHKNTLGITFNSTKFISSEKLIIDTGATDHMICNINIFNNLNLSQNNQHILVANGTKVSINGIGTINLFSKKKFERIIFRIIYFKFNFSE